jgi:hypothetical protein
VDHRTRTLADAQKVLELASSETVRRERAKTEREKQDNATAGSERGLLEDGELTVHDLARGAAWRVGAELKRAVMARAVDDARADQVHAGDVAERERAALLASQADAKAVEKNQVRWQKARADESLAKEEEDAEEAHLARSRGRKSP